VQRAGRVAGAPPIVRVAGLGERVRGIEVRPRPDRVVDGLDPREAGVDEHLGVELGVADQHGRGRGRQRAEVVGAARGFRRHHSRNLLTIGSRQSLPKARGVILMPIGPWRRLYSLRSTMAMTRRTVAGSKPRATMSAMAWSPST
jgi:hypothetical protein